jgi:hypothetical protein
MYPVSAKFLSALAGSHTPISYIEVWSSYRGTKLLGSLPFVTASVSIDSGALIRRELKVDFTDAQGSYVPKFSTDLLAPYGQELRPYRGIRYPDGTMEYVPLGCFPLTDNAMKYDGTDLPISLTAPDRAQLVQAAKATDFIAVAPGTNIAVGIQAVLNTVVPGLTFNLEPTAFTTTGIVIQPGDDPWKACSDMSASAGQTLAFDASGIVTTVTIPNPDTAPVACSYPDGALTTTTEVDKKLTVTGTYNVILVTGEGSGIATPVSAVAQDNNSASPTYVGGPLGSRVNVIKTDQASTVPQAQAIANAELNKYLGLTQQVGFTGIVNPALDAFDVITVQKTKLYLNGRFVVDKATIPLHWNDLMTVTTRARQL